MNSNQVKAYIDNEVQKLGDARVKPIIQSINGELETIRRNEAHKAAIDKEIADGNARIAKLQEALGKANTEVNDLAVKLAEATAGAVNTGATSA